MTANERVHAAMSGEAVDRMPVHVSYAQLYHMDHFDELTGLPKYHYRKWLHAGLDEFVSTFGTMLDAAPLDIVQPPALPPEPIRSRIEYVERDGVPYLHHRVTDTYEKVATNTKSRHNIDDYRANELEKVHDIHDIDEQVKIVPAERQIADGAVDGYRAIVEYFGADRFIMTGGVVGTIYGCGEWVGQTNLFMYLIEKPDLIDYLCAKITERNIETIRTLAAACGDAIYIDDATATSDMLSVAMYERFSLPYMKQMVDEIKRLGHRAVIIYFGGIADRLEQIASIGADFLNMEASMKGYRNDIGEIARAIGDRVSLCLNLNPYDHIERLTLDDLGKVMREYAVAALSARGVVAYSASPITMATPLSKVRAFIDIGRTLPVPHRLDEAPNPNEYEVA